MTRVRANYHALAATALLFIVSLFSLSLYTHVSATTNTVIKPGVPVSLKIPDTDLLVYGCVAPSSLVYISDNASTVGTVTSDSSGQYSRLLEAQTPTIHKIEVYFQDTNGVNSGSTSDLVALAVKTLTTHTANPPPTVSHSPNSVATGSSIALQGYACPGATVSVVIDGNVTLTATANAEGYWSTQVNSINFVAGLHSYTVSATGSGYSTINSPKGQFTVFAQTPADPVVADPIDLSIPVAIDSPDDGYRTNTRDVLVVGTGPPNAQIEVYADGVLVGSVFSNAFGEWSLTLSVLGAQQVLTARACDGSVCGDISNSVQVFYDVNSDNPGISTCDLRIRLLKYRFSKLEVTKGIDIDLEIMGEYSDDARFDIVTDWGDATIEHQTLDQTKLRMHHTYGTIGHFNGTLAIQAKDGCKDVVYFSVQVVSKKELSNISLWLIIFLLIPVTWWLRYSIESKKPS